MIKINIVIIFSRCNLNILQIFLILQVLKLMAAFAGQEAKSIYFQGSSWLVMALDYLKAELL